MKKLKRITLKHIEIVQMGTIKGGSLDCTTYPKRDNCYVKPDMVWCKVGDSCGKSDVFCGSIQPDSHDGCCTGNFDWGGDGRPY